MSRIIWRIATLSLLVWGIATASAPADTYTVDAVHSGAVFKISHVGVGWIFGRFNQLEGSFVIDKDEPAKSSFALTIKADSVDTGNAKRDNHLKSPDFFNAKQFPLITFKSTAVKAISEGYEVTGDLSLHGVSKSITFALKGGKEAQFPQGVYRTGFATDLVLKRTDFGMDRMVGPAGDEVHVMVALEGVKK